MSQRHLSRRTPMELSSSGFEGAPPQTSADAHGGVVIQSESNLPTFINNSSNNSSNNNSSNNNQWELQQLAGKEQDPLLLNSPSPIRNRHFTLWDLVLETVHLTRARSTYFLVLLLQSLTVMLLLQSLSGYLVFANRQNDILEYNELTSSCQKNILRPWVEAAMARNLTDVRQAEFYELFRQNCSTFFKDPATEQGTFKFKNGTISLSSHGGFALASNPITPHLTGLLAAQFASGVWSIWGQVAVTWGLYVATTSIMSHHSRPSHRDPIHVPSQRLAEAFQEQFSYKVFLGVIRMCLTETLLLLLSVGAEFFIATVRYVVVNRSASWKAINELSISSNRLWSLADPLPFLFLLSGVAAALEPGMWGFKALWRGVQLARGNRWKSYVVFLVLFFWAWLGNYLVSLLSQPAKELMATSEVEVIWRWVMEGVLGWVGNLPGSFLVPVLYFLCKSWRETQATMA